ncbi:alpha/beta fold hydrolase [Glycomyces harbinensis]|uniref:Haloacetate dehalogenase n=1 Tax=Glycomyces harbinensis TaxID=58114 RepID=A0A1G6R2D5_9ACTN|nr:alpha/beta hydrolase [Glycomyces harbinensis]SDC98718.1 haloacetate dehalogenase [Glycomyces harbinensis]
MFEGFTEWDIEVSSGVVLHGCSGGTGPALVLLHGHPRTHATWHKVAPVLAAQGLTVVCPDLRGYGRSSKPEPDAEHHVYSDRAMADDVMRLMTVLGHDRFAIAGHDRGSYVAYRAALDHPERVSALAVCDGVPILEALERADGRFAAKWWHWFFYGASPHAERVITADPMAWYEPDVAAMGGANYKDMVEAVTDPLTVRAMLEDYRAGLTVDRANDEADREAGRRIEAPTLVMWSWHDDMGELYIDPAAIWESWCELPVRQAVVESGHHMAEEAPEQVAEFLADFLAQER